MVVADPEAPGGERAKILDFGLAKLTEPESATAELTSTGTILGTPAYMAPEQCKSARAADDRSDVYSLGIILYEMLTADIPFDAETDAELLSMHMFQEPPSLAKRAPHVSQGLSQLVHRMLRKEPATRPSAGEVATELTQLLAAGDGEQPTAGPLPATRAAGAEGATRLSPVELTRDPRPVAERLPAPNAGPVGPAPSAEKPSTLPLWLLAAVLLIGCAGVSGLLWYRHQQAAQPVPTVHWSVSSIPDGAELIDADGHSLGHTPLALERPRGEGTQTMILRSAGFADQSLTFPLDLDAVRSEHLIALSPVAAGLAPGSDASTAGLLAAGSSADAGSPAPDAREAAAPDASSSAEPAPADAAVAPPAP